MIDKDLKNSNDIPATEDNQDGIGELEEISKSQLKRDADAIRELGVRLTELAASELATIPLPDDVLAAVNEYLRIKANGARKRQLGFLAKKLRNAEIAPIQAAIEKIRQSARANTLNLHLVEGWRDRLLGESENESAKQALTSFLSEFKAVDRQHVKHLQAQAIKERKSNRPPTAARQLFKLIRDEVAGEEDTY